MANTIYGDFVEVMLGTFLMSPNLPMGALLIIMQGLEMWHSPWKRKQKYYDIAWLEQS